MSLWSLPLGGRIGAALFVSTFLACVAGEEGAYTEPSAKDAAADGETGSSTDTTETDTDSWAPSSELESLLVGGPEDEYYADYNEHGVVFLRLRRDPVDPENPSPSHCLQCVSCEHCHWDLVFRAAGSDNDQVLSEDEGPPQSTPRLRDHEVVWLKPSYQESAIHAYDIENGDLRILHMHESTWIQSTPERRGDDYYWYGRQSHQTWTRAFFRSNRVTAVTTRLFDMDLDEPNTHSGNSQPEFADSQDFAMDDTTVFWSECDNGRMRINARPLSGGETTLAIDFPGWNVFRPTLHLGGLVFVGSEHSSHCHYNADDGPLVLYSASDNDPPNELTAAESQVTRYAWPAVDGSRLYWMDYRHGSYAIYMRDLSDLSGAEERISSADAVISTSSPIRASHGHVLWTDRRLGNWDLYVRKVASP